MTTLVHLHYQNPKPSYLISHLNLWSKLLAHHECLHTHSDRACSPVSETARLRLKNTSVSWLPSFVLRMKKKILNMATCPCLPIQFHLTLSPLFPEPSVAQTLLPSLVTDTVLGSLKGSSLPSTPNFPTISGTASLRVPSWCPNQLGPQDILTIDNYKLALSIGTCQSASEDCQKLLQLLA